MTTEDFEDSSLNFSFSGDWERTTQRSHNGSYSYGSSNAGQDSSTSSAEFTVDADGEFSMWYRISSESGFDEGKIIVNGTTRRTVSGSGSWEEFTDTLNQGDTVRVEYTKDGVFASNDDRFYIDDIETAGSSDGGGGDPGVEAGDEDFEDDNFHFNFSGDWSRTTTYSRSGSYSYGQSGASGSTSFTVGEAGELTIYYRKDHGFGNVDEIKINGVTEFSTQDGTDNGWELFQTMVQAGDTVEISYEKNDSFGLGADGFFVDDISLESSPPGMVAQTDQELAKNTDSDLVVNTNQ